MTLFTTRQQGREFCRNVRVVNYLGQLAETCLAKALAQVNNAQFCDWSDERRILQEFAPV